MSGIVELEESAAEVKLGMVEESAQVRSLLHGEPRREWHWLDAELRSFVLDLVLKS